LLSALALDTDGQQAMARMVARDLVLLVQADLLLRHAPDWLSRAFVDSRLGAPGGDAFGARPVALASDALLQRAWPGRPRRHPKMSRATRAPAARSPLQWPETAAHSAA